MALEITASVAKAAKPRVAKSAERVPHALVLERGVSACRLHLFKLRQLFVDDALGQRVVETEMLNVLLALAAEDVAEKLERAGIDRLSRLAIDVNIGVALEGIGVVLGEGLGEQNVGTAVLSDLDLLY